MMKGSDFTMCSEEPIARLVVRAGTQGKRPTVAFLIPRIYHVAQTAWLATLETAREQDVNLICFPGGDYAQSQANVLYDLISEERADALIVAPDNLRIPRKNVPAFLERFRPLPIISQGTDVPGFPSVVPDNYQGMREVIEHLIVIHGHRRIAFVRGPAGMAWEQERYRAYVDTLHEHGLPLVPELIVPTTSGGWPTGERILQVLLDRRGLQPGIDFEALALCADDADDRILQALQQRGIRVPHELAVTGFNDDPSSRAYAPPLTTVRQPLQEIGRQSLLLALASLHGETVPDLVTLPARLIVRRSCGCPSPRVKQAALGQYLPPASPEILGADISSARRRFIVTEIKQAVGDVPGAPKWIDGLVTAFVTEVLDAEENVADPLARRKTESGDTGDGFLSILEDQLNRTVAEGGDVEAWHDVLSALRRHVISSLGSHARAHADDLWHQGRVAISEAAQQEHAYLALEAEQRADALRDIGAALLGTLNLEALMRVLAEGMPRFRIPSAYLSLYEEPEVPAGWSRLILAYAESAGTQIQTGGLRFPSRSLMPAEMWPKDRRFSFVIEPLYFREEPLGFVLFEVGPHRGNVYDILRAQISSVLRAGSLYEQAIEARAEAERADRLKTRLLANVSHELRTPLNVILSHTQMALDSSTSDAPLSPDLSSSLRHIRTNAEHQLRMVNDLLDLSRAEIDALDLSTALIDPRPFLEEVFSDVANTAGRVPAVAWQLDLPPRLPAIQADPNRLRQMLFNLLSNAARFTETGQIVLGAEAAPPHLHVWVQDTGLGIPVDQQERIFEPFFTLERRNKRPEGIGLGLSITRRLVALHHGAITLESRPGRGSTFHIYLPLPALSGRGSALASTASRPALILVSSHEKVADEIVELSRRQGLEIRRLQAGDDLDALLAEVRPMVLAWDRSSTLIHDGILIRRLCDHPSLYQIPFMFYGQFQDDRGPDALASPLGTTNVLAKPVAGNTLSDVLSALCLAAPDTSILIVDDDVRARELYRDVARKALPGYTIYTAPDGTKALAMLSEKTPGLVILDLGMPEMDGFEVLDWMRARPETRRTPVLILSGRMLTFDDIQQLEGHAHVTLQSKDILSEEETITTLRRILEETNTLPTQTSSLVKRAVAYFHQNYDHAFSRQDMARAIGTNEDYLSKIFRQELGISLWDYLNRYRVMRAKTRLHQTDDSIATIAFEVGFGDPAYFSRVFRKLAGISPSTYRQRRGEM